MMAASTAHVWDKKVVACECYTGTPFNSKFTEHPYGMKALGDYIMTAGVNRFVYHATTHQPYTGDQPGNIMTMGPFGTHLDRMSTWASQFSALNLYNSRCAYMLQQGQYVADILYIKNEAISSGVNNYNTAYPATPFGYRWDIAGKEALLNLSFRDGFFTLPHGMKYRLLVMTPMERTSPEVLEQVIKLVSLGGKVLLVGEKASGYLGLNSEKDREVRRLAEILWGSSTLGKGRIYHACDLAEVLKEEHISPDFSFTSRNKDARIHFIHRSAGNDDVYFIANHLRRPEELTVSCRVSGKVPYLWNAENGETGIPVPYEEKDGNIRFNLDLEESGSIFVVFRTGDGAPSDLQTVEPVPTSVHTMQGDKPYSDDLDFHSTFTLSLWAKPETFAAGGRGYLVYPGTGTGNDARTGIAMGQNGVRIVERDEKSLRTVLEYTNPIEGWTHVGLVYKEGIPLLYLNGTLAAQGKKSENNCSPSADVPMTEEQFIGSFEGDRTEPEIYDYALTEEQIKEKAESGLPHPRVKGTIWKDFSFDWKVGFPAWSKIDKEIELPALQSLHKHSDFNVSHFSGTAVYEKKIMIRKVDWNFLKDKRLLLNLGRVENMAEVSVNGSDFVPVWKAPYACDVTGLLKEGENDIRIRVTNLYPNRIIGDEHLPERYDYDEYGRIRSLPDWYLKGETDTRERVLFLPWKYYKATDPLLESGLLGPVCLAYMDL